MNKIIFLLMLNVFLLSCSSFKTEESHYEGILAYMENDKYSKASREIQLFEAEYPESEHLCELWQIQIKNF